jgi:hypothetical protein
LSAAEAGGDVLVRFHAEVGEVRRDENLGWYFKDRPVGVRHL